MLVRLNLPKKRQHPSPRNFDFIEEFEVEMWPKGATNQQMVLSTKQVNQASISYFESISSGVCRKYGKFGGTRGIRTPDPRFRRPMLYPAELLYH